MTNEINVREYQSGNHKKKKTHKKNNPQHNTICVGHHSTQTNTNNVKKTSAVLQRTEGKDEPNIVLCRKRNALHNTQLRT
jgi:hypothetical protein